MVKFIREAIPREGSHRVQGKPRTATERLEEAAQLYGYSSRRFCDMVKKGLVLGISYRDGKYEFECESYEISGTITEEPREIIMPRGTEKISISCSIKSKIKGAFYYSMRSQSRRRLSIEVQTEPGRSGMIIAIYVEPNRFLDDLLRRT